MRLVPDYDNLITTRADERFVAKGRRPKVFLPGLCIAATVLVDGFVAGTWRTDRRKEVATLGRAVRAVRGPRPAGGRCGGRGAPPLLRARRPLVRGPGGDVEATTTTASRPTAPGSRSATARRATEGRSSTRCPRRAGRRASRRTPPRTGNGWSPDGRTLAYCAERGGEFDVHTIPVEGGDETRLTTAPGLDDGPDYSPDGQWVAFLSYDSDVKGHPPNKDVMLRMMPAGGGAIQVLARLFGGQGTINVPSWSPDGSQLAFGYRLARR